MNERTLIITGGTGGLGSEVVRRLERDYRCIVFSRATAGLPDHVQVDVTNEESVRRAIEQVGPFYGLVHLVGGFAPGSVAETSTERWSQMLALNLTAAFIVIREALPRMQRPGRIIAISSEASLQKPAGIAAYAVSKSALNTLIQITAAELKEARITANALLPSALDTPAMRKEMDRSKLVPLERVAEAIAFLLSEAGASVSGALIPLHP
jgi:NAD(P)-dependent dehydrogenase (short-subunit alcohol dehydrogenase family)